LILFVAAGAVAGGVQLAAFALDARNLMSGAAATRASIGGEAGAAVSVRLDRWRAMPGVAATASELLTVDPNLPKREGRRMLDIIEAVAENPTAGRLWLAYAEEVQRSGYGKSYAISALRLSQIVERRRAGSMLRRARIVIGAWEQMPNDLRRSSIAELAALRSVLGKSERDAIAAVAATKSPEVRAEIRDMLLPQLGKFGWSLPAMGF
jgi:hypothetical protein